MDDGPLIPKSIGSLDDLVKILPRMSESEFKGKLNSFTQFIKNTKNAPAIADEFSKAGSPEEASELLKKYTKPSVEVPAKNIDEVMQYANSLSGRELMNWVSQPNIQEAFDKLPGCSGLSRKVGVCEDAYEIRTLLQTYAFGGAEAFDKACLPEVVKPRDIVQYLNKYVISQEEAKRNVATLIYKYLKAINNEFCTGRPMQRTNAFIVGATGTGKTYIPRKACQFAGLNLAEIDCSQYSASGYHGANVANIPFDIVKQVGDPNSCWYTVVLLDEFDKKKKYSGGGDVSGGMVQNELLKLIEGKPVDLGSDEEMAEFFEGESLYTGDMLFFVLGAFSDIEDTNPNPIGLGKKLQKVGEFDYKCLGMQELEKYGILPELFRRAPVIIPLEPLRQEDLKNILVHSQDSPLLAYADDYGREGVDLRFEDSALDYMASLAYGKNMGASGLEAVFHGVMKEFDYVLPDLQGVDEIRLTEEVCRYPREAAEKLLKKA